MHVLILNTHSLHSQFIQKGLRYENIGADTCRLENLSKIWYGQYDALIIPIKSWEHPPFHEIQKTIKGLGKIPTIISSRLLPPPQIKNEIEIPPHIQFIGSHLPFHVFTQSIKNTINQQSSAPEKSLNIIKIGELQIDLKSRQTKRENKFIFLRNKEFGLLESLMRNPGKVLTRTFILENVWDHNTSILSNTVDVHVNRLRKKIDYGFQYSMIQTVPCIGYRLLPEWEINQSGNIK